MIEIGRICIKTAGRDAGREAVIVDILNDKYVLIDGNVRRRKCNILHLEPTGKKIEIKKGASHEEVKNQFKKLNLPVWETKPKQKTERPRKRKKKRETKTTSKESKKKEKEKEKEDKKEDKKERKKEKQTNQEKDNKPQKATKETQETKDNQP